MQWFIKTHRRILESQIWEKPSDWFKIWSYLLLSARYMDDREDIPLWSILTTYKNIEINCNVSYDTVYNAMQWLKVQGMVQVQKRNRKVLIQLKNWEKYNGGTGTETTKVQNKYEISTDTIIEEGKKVRKKEIYIWATRSEVIIELNNFITYWNKNFKIERKITPHLENDYLWVRKKYPKDDIAKALQRYIDKKKWWPTEYELTPRTFLTQNNWFTSYL